MIFFPKNTRTQQITREQSNIIRADIFPMMSFKDLAKLYFSLTKNHDLQRELICQQIINILLKAGKKNHQEHMQVFRFRQINHLSLASDKLGQVSAHIFQEIAKNPTSLSYKVLALGFLTRLRVGKVDLAEDDFNNWLNQFIEFKETMVENPIPGRDYSRYHVQRKNFNHISLLIIKLLTPEQVMTCYQRAISILNNNASDWEMLVGALKALKSILPIIFLEKKEQEILVVRCYSILLESNNYLKNAILDVLEVCLRCLTDETLRESLCQNMIDLAVSMDYFLRASMDSFLTNSPSKKNTIQWGSDNRLNEDKDHFFLTYFKNLLTEVSMSDENRLEDTENLKIMVSYMSASYLDKAWEHFINEIECFHKNAEEYGPHFGSIMYKGLLTILSAISLQMNGEVIINASIRFLDDFIQADADSPLLKYMIPYCDILGEKFFQDKAKLSQVFEHIFSLINMSSYSNDDIPVSISEVLLAMLPYCESSQMQKEQLYNFLVASYKDKRGLCVALQNAIAYFGQTERLLGFNNVVALLEDPDEFVREFAISAIGNMLPYIDTKKVINLSEIIAKLISLLNSQKKPDACGEKVLSIFPTLAPFITDETTLRTIFSKISVFLTKSEYTHFYCNYINYDKILLAICSIFQFHGNHFSSSQELLNAVIFLAPYNENALNLLCQLVIQGDENTNLYLANNNAGEGEAWRFMLDYVVSGIHGKKMAEVIIDNNYFRP